MSTIDLETGLDVAALAATIAATDPTATDAERVIAGLRADVEGSAREITALREALREAQAATRAAVEKHQADIDYLSTTLNEEAESRDWCGEYDRLVSDANTRLTFPLQVREREYQVQITGYVRVPFSHYITITVPADADVNDYAADAAHDAMTDVSAGDVDVDRYNAEIEEWEVSDVERA